MGEIEDSGYCHGQAFQGCCTYAYLLPTLTQILKQLDIDSKEVFDLGCGNGAIANWLTEQGYSVCGCDPSRSGIAEANLAFPTLDLRLGSTEDRLSTIFGTFELVVSFEVVEHVYAPRNYAACLYNLLVPGGYAVISTPYHGYWKNLALALTGQMDSHFTALWDHGHIKFWSIRTITQLLTEAGFRVVQIQRIGRISALAKTMTLVVQRPLE